MLAAHDPQGSEGADLRMPLRIVFDTNVLLSLWVFDKRPGGSKFAPLRTMIESGAVLALSRPDCLAEFARVLGYPEFKLTPATQRVILDEYSELIAPTPVTPATAAPDQTQDRPLPRCSDRDDQMFLELARDGAAQVLVTSDKALLKLARRKQLTGMFRIVKPEQLLAELMNDAEIPSP